MSKKLWNALERCDHCWRIINGRKRRCTSCDRLVCIYCVVPSGFGSEWLCPSCQVLKKLAGEDEWT